MLIGGNQEVVVLGIFKDRIDSQENDTVVGKQRDGDRWNCKVKSNEFGITNGFYAHKEIQKFM